MNKISASDLSRKFTKGALLVGWAASSAPDLRAQSVLSGKVSASELRGKFVKIGSCWLGWHRYIDSSALEIFAQVRCLFFFY